MTLAASVYSAPLRTSPFVESPLLAFERDFRAGGHDVPLRTCPFDQPQLPLYFARLQSAFLHSPPPGGRLDAWA